MGAGVLAVDIIFTAALTAYLLNKYGDPKKSYPVTFVVGTAWFFSFVIVFVLPLDISAVGPALIEPLARQNACCSSHAVLLFFSCG